MGNMDECLRARGRAVPEGSRHEGISRTALKSACFVATHRFLIGNSARIVLPSFGVKNHLLQKEEKRSRVVDRRHKYSLIFYTGCRSLL